MAVNTVEFIEGLEVLTDKKSVESYVREFKPNKNNCTAYSKAVQSADLSISPELKHTVQTKDKGAIETHYACKVLYDIQRELAAQKAQKTVQQEAVEAQEAGKIAIDVNVFVQGFRDGLKASDWRIKLAACCLLTGRRIGAVAFEASFEVISSYLLKVVSGQKQRGEINTVLIPTLAPAQDVYDAIQEVRSGIEASHGKALKSWNDCNSPENGRNLSNSITGSAKYKSVYDRNFRPLFNGSKENYTHSLRAVYGCIIGECHQQVMGSASASKFAQLVLDHDSVGTTAKYLDGHRLEGIEEFLETMPEDFIKLLDAKAYEAKPKTYIPFNFDGFVSAISNESARVELASLLENPDSFAENLGRMFDRLYAIKENSKPSEGSASSKIERVINAILDYNISQQGSAKPAYVHVSVPLINTVGKAAIGKTFDSKTASGVLDRMAGKLEQQYKALDIKPNQNLFYRKDGRMEQIVGEIAAQYGVQL